MELNFFYAKHKHKMWKMHLKAYLLDIDDIDEKRIVSSNDCELGKWINGFAINKYKDNPDLEQLIQIHNKIHVIVKDIPRLKKKGEIEKAQENYNNLEKESQRLIKILETFEVKENSE